MLTMLAMITRLVTWRNSWMVAADGESSLHTEAEADRFLSEVAQLRVRRKLD